MTVPLSKRPADPASALDGSPLPRKKPCVQAIVLGSGDAAIKRPDPAPIDPDLDKLAQCTTALRDLCDAGARDSLLELRTALSASDVVKHGLDSLLFATPGALTALPSFDYNAMFACVIEGSALTFTQLQEHISHMVRNLWPSDAISETILKIADRKSYGVKFNKKAVGVDVKENQEVKYRWRWEVLQKDFIPGDLRKWVLRERAIESVAKKLIQVREDSVRTARGQRKPEAKFKLLRLNDEADRLIAELEQKIGSNQSARDAERQLAEKRQQKQIVKGTKGAAPTPTRKQKLHDKMSKEAQFMAGFLSSPARPRTSDIVPTSRMQQFMPFHIPAHTTLAPTLPDGERRVPDLRLFDPGDDRTTDLDVFRSRRPSRRRSIRKKLLQFHTEFRPPFFSLFHRRSSVVVPRRPFARDSALDYTVDSDDEWEDEEEGEDVDGSEDDESEDECDPECSRRGDGLEEDGWLDPEEHDIAANIPETSNSTLRIIGPVHVPDAVNALSAEDRSELLDQGRILLAEVLDVLTAPAVPAKSAGPQTATITQFFQRKSAIVQ